MRKPWLLLFLVVVSLASAQDSRHFTFHYGFTVKNVPAGERVRVWIPAARSDDFQEVKVISANGDLKLKKTRESRFGNQMYLDLALHPRIRHLTRVEASQVS